MRKFLATLVLCALALGAGSALAAKPNIVFIMADDMGYGDPHCFNADSKVPTPNLDKLAASGMRFTDEHASGSLCVPSRYALVTGRYMWRRDEKGRGGKGGYAGCLIERDRPTIASVLKQAGYTTGVVGKWHLGLGEYSEGTDLKSPVTLGPKELGFDYSYILPASLDIPPYVFVENGRVTAPLTREIPDHETPNVRWASHEFWRGGMTTESFKMEETLPTVVRKSVAFVREHAKAEAPYFLYAPFTAPHTPWLPLAEFKGRSKAGDYGDFVAQVDAAVGQVLQAIKESGEEENTLVFFTSDNGAFWIDEEKAEFNHFANGPLRGEKADAWEGGHRMPFIVRWPGKVQPGTSSRALISHVDTLATVAEVAGVPMPEHGAEDSFSYLPVLLGKAEHSARQAMVHEGGRRACIRVGDWKLITFLGSGGFTKPKYIEPGPGDPKGQLYNLATDLGETNNLYAEKPEIVARLTAELERLQKAGQSR